MVVVPIGGRSDAQCFLVVEVALETRGPSTIGGQGLIPVVMHAGVHHRHRGRGAFEMQPLAPLHNSLERFMPGLVEFKTEA